MSAESAGGTWPTIKRDVAARLSEFFGIMDSNEEELMKKWKSRSEQLHANNVVFSTLRSRTPVVSSLFSHEASAAPASHADDGVYHAASSQGRDQADFSPYSHTYPRNREARPRSFRSLSRIQRTPVRTYQFPKQEPVLQMALNGILSVTKRSKPPSRPVCRMRSFKRTNLFPGGRVASATLPLPRDVNFFDDVVPTSQFAPVASKTLPSRGLRKKKKRRSHQSLELDDIDASIDGLSQHLLRPKELHRKESEHRVSQHGLIIPTPVSTAVTPTKEVTGREQFLAGMKRIGHVILDEVLDNTDREVGVGFVGRWLDWDQRTSQIDSDVKKQIDEITLNEHRPFFTYWVTFVQIVCFIVAVSIYGISTVGVSETIVEGEVLTRSLSVEKVYYVEEDNFWIGPRQADLIHLGARFSPCMRKDANVEAALLQSRQKENETACCVLNDGSGCYQSDQQSCSKTLATWLKWTGLNESQFRFSGSICGQDPRFCLNPQSLLPFVWPDEIVSWPVCQLTSPPTVSQQRANEYRHMTCPIVGRPCCVGIKGDCTITTREHCTFLRGFFHSELFLCSQVSCLNEICAMIPFYNPDQPDQFYRLWTSLFIHAGIFQLIVSILFQVFIMRDLEKLAGPIRVCIIYVVSGIGGSLASSIFVPYHVEAGPSGSQFGLIACLFTDVVHNWKLITNPGWALGKLIIITTALFVLGLLPMIDNYAHLFGFVFGFLLSFALLPYVTFGLIDARNKFIGVIVCLVVCVCLVNVLIVLFYVAPIYNCPGCQYFNCVPFTDGFCKSMEVKIVYNS